MELTTPRRCIISLATSHKLYRQSLLRLGQSLTRSGFAGQFLSWPPEPFPAGCPEHLEAPFAFKPFCFIEAQRRGMDLVLWLDASCVVVRPLDAVFQRMQEQGHVLFRNRPFRVGQWASDEALRKLSVTREQAMEMPEISGGAIGLNMRSPMAVQFLRRWHQEAIDQVAFRGVNEPLAGPEEYGAVKWNKASRVSAHPMVRGHRHDQTVAGILAHQLGMEPTNWGLRPYSRARRAIGLRTTILIDRDVRRARAELTTLEQVLKDRYTGQVARLLDRLRTWVGAPKRGAVSTTQTD